MAILDPRSVTEEMILAVVRSERTLLAKTTQTAITLSHVRDYVSWFMRGGRLAIPVATNGAIVESFLSDGTSAYIAYRLLGIEPVIERVAADHGAQALITRPWLSLDVIGGGSELAWSDEDTHPG